MLSVLSRSIPPNRRRTSGRPDGDPGYRSPPRRACACGYRPRQLPSALRAGWARCGSLSPPRVAARWLVRVGGQDCDGPFVRQAPIGSRPIRSASYRMIRRCAMTDRSKRGHEVSQLEGQAITHRHPPVSQSDTDRRENDAHSQLNEWQVRSSGLRAYACPISEAASIGSGAAG